MTFLTRSQFIRRSSQAVGALAFCQTFPQIAGAESTPASFPEAIDEAKTPYDLRDFVQWIETTLEPAVRLGTQAGNYAREFGAKTPELYGVADMACILYSIGKLNPTEKERLEWSEAFQNFQTRTDGFLVEKEPSHPLLHNTAFALGAMQLLALQPKLPLKIPEEYQNIKQFLGSLDWKTKVYGESHKGAGIGAVFALVPALHSKAWFDDYFSFCDGLFDAKNGLMGRDKPPQGDFDQIGGTFHYAFLYNHFNRRMPYPEARINTVLGLQQPDGYWEEKNHLWLTLDAIYLLTRTLRTTPHRVADVHACLRRTMDALMRDVYSPQGRKTTFTGKLAVHSVTAAINIVAELQNFWGADHIVTDWPVHLVLDRRPFI